MHGTMIAPIREFKRTGNDDAMTFAGYGSVFGNVDSYGDVVAPGAFSKTLAEARSTNQWPAMLLQHGGFMGGAEDMTPVGIWTTMHEDNTGLYVEGKLADTQRGREAYALLKMEPRPAITGLSIGYRPLEWTSRSKPEEPRRTLKSVDLLEVSLVTFPANGKARVSAVKANGINTIREFERFLREEAGFSRARAEHIAKHGFKAADHRDDGGEAEIVAALRRNLSTLQTIGKSHG